VSRARRIDLALPDSDDMHVSTLPPISAHERHWNAEIARRRPDLVVQEVDSLGRMTERYREFTGSAFGMVAQVHTDRVRVLRHLIDEVSDEPSPAGDAASEAGRHLATQVGRNGAWTDRQAERLAELIKSHSGATPDIMATGDGTIVVSFGPRRGNGAYVVDPHGSSHWVNPGRYAT
jgi:plasmid stabilization system protein ParE